MICISADHVDIGSNFATGMFDNIYTMNTANCRNVYEEISTLGIALEELLLEKDLVWSNSCCNSAILVWKNSKTNFNEISKYVSNFRGDEIFIEDLNNIPWIAGNPRALIKVASTIFKINNLYPERSVNAGSSYDVIEHRLIWWIQRNNIKLYTVPLPLR